MGGVTFYLGTHEPSWLARTRVPLFISRRRLARLKRLPSARGRWALDSGPFSELAFYRTWRTTPACYAAEVRQYRDRVGRLDWATIQDWMVDPATLSHTGKTVREHQELTVGSWVELSGLAPEVPWVPVLQGRDL